MVRYSVLEIIIFHIYIYIYKCVCWNAGSHLVSG